MTLEERAALMAEDIGRDEEELFLANLRAVRDEALEEAANVAAKKADAIDTFRCPTVEACRGRPGYGSSRQYGTLANIARRVAIEITNRILDLKKETP